MAIKDWDEILDDVDPGRTLPVDEVLDDEQQIDYDAMSVDDLMDLVRDGDRRALAKLHDLRS